MKSLIVATVLTALSAVHAARPAAQQPVIKVSCDRQSCRYRVGETGRWTFTACRGDVPMTNGLMEITFDNYGPKTLMTVTNDIAKANPFVIPAALDEPGFLRATARLVEGGKALRVWGAAYDPEKIVKGSPRPADFDSWWDAQVAKLEREVPLDPQIRRLPERCTDKFEFYRISFATARGKRSYGYLSVPTKKGPHPACVIVPGAGEGAWTNNMSGDPDEIMMFITVHDFEPPFDMKELAKRYKEISEKVRRDWDVGYYAQAGLSGARDDAYYLPAILGVNRAVNWLAADPRCDASRITYVGSSQGGGFGLYLAALNRHISRLCVTVPALSDTMGYLKGRQSGWPRPVESQAESNKTAAAVNAPYYDAANFASRIRCPVRVAVGYSDNTCAPCAVWAMFNALGSSDKKMTEVPGMGHSVNPSVWREFTAWRKQQPPKTAKPAPARPRPVR